MYSLHSFGNFYKYRDMLEPYVCDTALYLHKALKFNKNVLLEGQLGTLKDPDRVQISKHIKDCKRYISSSLKSAPILGRYTVKPADPSWSTCLQHYYDF